MIVLQDNRAWCATRVKEGAAEERTVRPVSEIGRLAGGRPVVESGGRHDTGKERAGR